MKRKINFICIFVLLIPITFSNCFKLGNTKDNGASNKAYRANIGNLIKGAVLMAGQSNMEGNVSGDLFNNIVDQINNYNGDQLKTNLEATLNNSYPEERNAFEAQELVRLKNEGIVGDFLRVARSDVWASFNSDTVSGLKNGFGNPIGSELTLGQYLGNRAPASISLIKVAHGGTTLYDHWLSPSGAARLGKSVGPLYIELKNRIQSIKSNPNSVNPDYNSEWLSFVWFQGENDCFGEINAQTYEANLRDLIQDVRNEIGNPNLLVVVVELNAWASGLPFGNVILAAQNAVAASDPNVEIVKCNDLSTFYHMDPAAHFIIGERIGKALENLLISYTGPAGFTWCANEWGTFTLPGTCDVAYGAYGKFKYLFNQTGTITFDNNTFGDPIVGMYKAGYYRIRGDSWYVLRARHSGKVLDVSGISYENGANIHQWDWWNGDNQQWQIQNAGDGYVYLKAKHSGQYMDIWNGSIDNKAPVIQWPFHGGPNQQFQIESASDGYVYLKAKHSGQYLDVTMGYTDNGAPVIQWPFHGGHNQQWRLEPAN